jgi:hypothetical protein
MEDLIINREGDYKNETISSLPIGINNIMINNNENTFDLKKDDINNIKPMLSSNPNTIIIRDGKKKIIKPSLNKKIPTNSFSMMANSKKKFDKSSDESSTGTSNDSYTNEILTNNSNGNQMNEQVESEYEEEDPDDFSSINSNIKNKFKKDSISEYEEEEDDEEEEEPKTKQKTYEEIQQEKQKLLFNLERLQKQGYPPSKKYSMASSYEDMQFEHERLKKQRDVEKSIKFSRKILMAFVSGAEFLNNRFDPCDVKLDGWSENVMENVSDYDEVFEELHDKYSDSVKMAPELKLLGLVGGSLFMFHLTNSLFKSASPKLSDILKQNPDIMKNISEAAAKNMGNTINQQFGQDDFIGNMMKDGINTKINQQRNNFVGPNSNQQKKMNGPVGIDELLNELNSGGNSNSRDDISVSSKGSINIKTSAKRTNASKKGGIQLDIR